MSVEIKPPTFEDIFAVMSAAAVGDAEARVAIPEHPDIEEPATRFAIAVNLLLDDLDFRSKQAKAALESRVEESHRQFKESEEKFTKAFRASPAAISIASMPDGRWLEVNEAHEAMTGYSREESIGHTSAELGLVDPEERAKIIKAFQEKGSIRDVDVRLRTKSGNHVDVLVSVENIELDGKPCAITIQYDITELKRAEREVRRLNANLEREQAALEESNKELESFSYSVAHDLRAPLRSIDGFSKMIVDRYAEKLDAQGNKYLDTVRKSAQKMAQLIDDLLSLSRVVSSEIRRAPMDLSAMAHGVAARLSEGEPERRTGFSIAEGIVASGDPVLMSMVLENLLGNAWKFTSKRPAARIEFGCEDKGGMREYFVRDNGAGFDMAYADKLFGVFQRLHSNSEFEGTGIGLATVQRVIHRHGGKVWGHGEVGGGAVFRFTLGTEFPTA
jgi:PAS domain S-box-containing protein